MKTKWIGLKRYCRWQRGAGGDFSRPVFHNDNTYITDGWWVIKTKGQLADAIPSHVPIKIDQAMISTCRKCKGLGIVKVCYECNGEGEVETETEYNTYEHECKTCHGNCVIPPENEEKAEKCSYCKGFGGEGVLLGTAAPEED